MPTATRTPSSRSSTADGYPTSVAGEFRTDAEQASLDIGPLSARESCPPPAPRCASRSATSGRRRGSATTSGATSTSGVRRRSADDQLRVTATRATGWDEADIPFFEYAERSVPVAHEYMEEVGDQRPHLSKWWTFFLATRLPFLTATIVPVALGGAVAAANDAFAWGWWLLALVAACAVHLGLNIANDIFDDASGADAANVTPTPFSGGSRVIQYGLVTRRAMVRACAGFYAVAVGIGLFLAAERGWWLLAIGAVGVALSLAYTAPPFRLVHRGLGEPVTALGFGPVMTLGAYFVCAQAVELGGVLHLAAGRAAHRAGPVREPDPRPGRRRGGRQAHPDRALARVAGDHRVRAHGGCGVRAHRARARRSGSPPGGR